MGNGISPAARGHLYLRCFLWGLAILPALLLVRIIILDGFNLPYMDEWMVAPRILHFATGHGSWSDLWTRHNDYRLVVPMIVWCFLARFTHWDTRYPMYLSYVAAGVTSAMVLVLCRYTADAYRPQTTDESRQRFSNAWTRNWHLLFWFAANLLIFNTVQSENWLWGFGFANLLPAMWLLIALVVAVSRLSFQKRFALCVALSILSTYSAGHGLILWIVLPPVLFVGANTETRSRRAWIVGWCGAGLLSLAFYFYGYDFSRADPSHISSVLQSVNYLLVFLGGAISSGTTIAVSTFSAWLGAVMLVIYLALCYVAAMNLRLPQARPMLVWLALGAFAILSGVMATIARSGLGIDQALAPRYASFSLYLPLAIIQLVPLSFVATRKGQSPWRSEASDTAVAAVVATVILGLSLLTWNACLVTCTAFRLTRREGRAELMFINFFQEKGLLVDVNHLISPELLKQRANALSSAGLLNPPVLNSNDIEPLKAAGRTLAPEKYGQIDDCEVTEDGELRASGWAVLPLSHRPADAVLLTCQSPTGQQLVFAVARITHSRSDVGKLLKNPDLATCGWSEVAPVTRIPHRPTTVRAWAFDTDELKAYPLAREAGLP